MFGQLEIDVNLKKQFLSFIDNWSNVGCCWKVLIFKTRNYSIENIGKDAFIDFRGLYLNIWTTIGSSLFFSINSLHVFGFASDS